MKKGDLIVFYHSNCETPVRWYCEVVREAYPDHTSFDPLSPYYDAKAAPQNPRWFVVDVRWKEDFQRTVSLREMRNTAALKRMKVLEKGLRLSVMPSQERSSKRFVPWAGRLKSSWVPHPSRIKIPLSPSCALCTLDIVPLSFHPLRFYVPPNTRPRSHSPSFLVTSFASGSLHCAGRLACSRILCTWSMINSTRHLDRRLK